MKHSIFELRTLTPSLIFLYRKIVIMIFGCDEAGKGPVLGSMFVACVKGEQKDIPSDVRDSKSLSNKKIHSLAEAIRENMDVSISEATSSEIDNNQMTDLSVSKFSSSIRSLPYEECDSGFIDCFVNNRKTVENRIRNELDAQEGYNLVVEFSADKNYNIVSAASIIAKSERENHVEKLSQRYGDIGSGYPSDPNTREFLSNYIDKNGVPPECARKSWSTIDDMLEENS